MFMVLSFCGRRVKSEDLNLKVVVFCVTWLDE